MELTNSLDGLRTQNKTLRDQEIYWTCPSGINARFQIVVARQAAARAQAAAEAAAEAARNAHMYRGREPGDHESRGSNW